MPAPFSNSSSRRLLYDNGDSDDTRYGGKSRVRCCACAARHPRACRSLSICCALFALLLVGLAIFAFLLYGVTGAELVDETVIDVFDMCSFSGITLVVNGALKNPGHVPLSIVGGTYVVRDTSDGRTLGSGSIPPLDIYYGHVLLQNVTLSVTPGDAGVLGDVVSSYFHNNPLTVVLDADVRVHVFGIELSTSVSKEFHFNEHTTPNGQKPFRWVSFDLLSNDAERAVIHSTAQLKSRLPWVHAHVPTSLSLDISYDGARIATVVPESDDPHHHGAWLIKNGWNTLAATASVSRANATKTGQLINRYLEKKSTIPYVARKKTIVECNNAPLSFGSPIG